MGERGETDLELEMWRRFKRAERKVSTGGGDAVLPPLRRTTPPPVDPDEAA